MMNFRITGMTKAENDQHPEVHLCTIMTSRQELMGAVVMESLRMVRGEPNLRDSIKIEEGR